MISKHIQHHCSLTNHQTDEYGDHLHQSKLQYQQLIKTKGNHTCLQCYLFNDEMVNIYSLKTVTWWHDAFFRCFLSALLYFSLCSTLGSRVGGFLRQKHPRNAVEHVHLCHKPVIFLLNKCNDIWFANYHWNNTENVSIIMF